MKSFLKAITLFCLTAGSLNPLFAYAQTNTVNTGNTGDSTDSGQALVDDKGNIFMEEVDVPKKKKIEKVPIDLSRVGVSVDPKGNIVPIKDGANDFWAGSGVKPFYNKIEQSTELPYGLPGMFGYAPYYPGLNKTWNPGGPGNFYGYPYNYGGLGYGLPYNFNTYPYGYGQGYPYGNPYFNGNLFNNNGLLFGNPYGYGNSYGYGNPYGYPGVQPLATLRLGNFQATLGTSPLFRPTTYSQTSMWKAFNLAF